MIEYRVRAVTRYVITRYEETGNTGSIETIEIFDSNEVANKVCSALHLSEPGSICKLLESPQPRLDPNIRSAG